MIIGLSASGRTPYVVGAIAYARARCAKTACITCNHGTPLAGAADIAIVADVGPEVISGSTRMKAATAQKMITNTITILKNDPSRLRVRKPDGQRTHAEH